MIELPTRVTHPPPARQACGCLLPGLFEPPGALPLHVDRSFRNWIRFCFGVPGWFRRPAFYSLQPPSVADPEGEVAGIGFQPEGILRWNQVVADADIRGKVYNGCERPPYGEQNDGGRDMAYLSLCWDDWVNGKREVVDALSSRYSGLFTLFKSIPRTCPGAVYFFSSWFHLTIPSQT